MREIEWKINLSHVDETSRGSLGIAKLSTREPERITPAALLTFNLY